MRLFTILCAVALFPATAHTHDVGHFHVHGMDLTLYHVCIVAGVIAYVLRGLGKRGQ